MMPWNMTVKHLWQVHLLHKPQQHSHIPHYLHVGLDLLFHLSLLSGHIIMQRHTSILCCLFSLFYLTFSLISLHTSTKVPKAFLAFAHPLYFAIITIASSLLMPSCSLLFPEK